MVTRNRGDTYFSGPPRVLTTLSYGLHTVTPHKAAWLGCRNSVHRGAQTSVDRNPT